jgi:hypothetical protein
LQAGIPLCIQDDARRRREGEHLEELPTDKADNVPLEYEAVIKT